MLVRRTINFPLRVTPQWCVKPRKSKVSGFLLPWNVGSPRRLRPVRSLVQSIVKIPEVPFEIPLVLLPRHPVDSRCRALLDTEECALEPFEVMW